MKTKHYILAILLLTAPNLAVAPTTERVEHSYPTYLKVMAFEDHFDDSFNIYIFGSAKNIRVRNPQGLPVPYNEISYLQLDHRNRIIDLKLEH